MSRYLTGGFRTLRGEHTETALTVDGHLPGELDGLFTQIGPAPAGPPRMARDGHYPWFMQDGLLCGVRLRGGRAMWFRNRWIRSRRAARSLGVSPATGPRHFPYDSVNTNVIAHHGLLLALVESGCLPVELSATLESRRYTDLGGQLPRGFAAHPKIDVSTGELHLLAYSPLRTWAEYIVLTATGQVSRMDRVDLDGRPLLHDIALTPGHVVFFDTPVRFHLGAGMAGGFPYRWRDSHQARIGVLPRGGGPARWVAVDPCFLYHLVGAEETTGGGLIVRGLRYERLFDRRGGDPLAGPATLWEWRVEPGRDFAPARQLDDQPQELPRADPRRQGLPSRYYYAVTNDPGNDKYGLLKYDLHRNSAEHRRLDTDQVPGETVFVPAAGSTAEDHGWLVHFRYDATRDASDLVVRDARDLDGRPVAVVRLPVRVPVGAHSSWITAAELPGPEIS
ncbi:carotenoid oxygenase family protein [Actinoplanes sp. M2I2]|uniref:carotenoid oxygenase family protein n=1 Tax=Actinoplanes sp. M2I2 TaxID=1734444 RepID=UPI0020227BC4|nr:carotenoid oxygenase family protein [Actinoplanes sp. M2I2]